MTSVYMNSDPLKRYLEYREICSDYEEAWSIMSEAEKSIPSENRYSGNKYRGSIESLFTSHFKLIQNFTDEDIALGAYMYETHIQIEKLKDHINELQEIINRSSHE